MGGCGGAGSAAAVHTVPLPAGRLERRGRGTDGGVLIVGVEPGGPARSSS